MRQFYTFLLLSFLMVHQSGLTQTWTEIPPTLTASFINSGVAYDGKVYFSGGPQTQYVYMAPYNSNLQILDLATETITTAPIGISEGRCAMSTVAYDGKIYFMGGHRWTNLTASGFITYDNVDIYDIETGTWDIQHLSLSRSSCAAAVVKGKIVIAGGWHATATSLEPSDVVDIYDPINNQWTVEHLSVPRGEMLEAGVVGSKVYICGGGINGSNFVSTDLVDVFDIDSSTWSTTHISLARSVPSVVGVGKYLVCAGGYDQAFGKTNRVDILNTETGLWTTHSLSQARAVMATAVLGGKAYFTGGGNLDIVNVYFNQTFNNVDIFDSNTNTWSSGHLNKDRMAHACAAWDNKIVVGGGWRAQQAVTTGSIEILTDSTISAIPDVPTKPNIAIFPNPTSSEITIELLGNSNFTDPLKVTLYDLTSRVSFKGEIRGHSEQFDIGSLLPGMYLVEVRNGEVRYLDKLLVAP